MLGGAHSLPASRSEADATRNWLSRHSTVTCCRREHLEDASGWVITRVSASKPASHILLRSCSASPRTLGFAVEEERTIREDSMREVT